VIYLIVGDNQYRVRQEIAKITRDFSGEVVRVDGAELTANSLADLVMGATLFSEHRTIIIRDLSDNATLWQQFEQWTSRVSDTNNIILCEKSVDKRTKVYKSLLKSVRLIEATQWTEREYRDAEAWLDKTAHQNNVLLQPRYLKELVRRATHAESSGKTIIDQSELYQALKSLSLLEQIDDTSIDAVMPPDLSENIYELFATALGGDRAALMRMLEHLKVTEEPYKVFGLIASQWFQYAALCLARSTPSEVAADLGVNAYGLQKLGSYRGLFTPSDLHALTQKIAQLDIATKSTVVDPWYQTERFLLEVVQVRGMR
jgi:DNA polymerase-3 subunit delta